jgi:hypothetical protein
VQPGGDPFDRGEGASGVDHLTYNMEVNGDTEGTTRLVIPAVIDGMPGR